MNCPHCAKAIWTMDIVFNFAAGVVESGGRSVKLGPVQMHILEHLIDAYPRGMPTPDLANAVYPDSDTGTECNAVRASLHVIKAKFAEAGMPWEIGRLSRERGTLYALMPTHVQAFAKSA